MTLSPDILKEAQDEFNQWRARKRARLSPRFLEQAGKKRKSRAKCFECGAPVLARRRCRKHYFRWRRVNMNRVGQKVLPLIRRAQCECGSVAQKNGWCLSCNQAYRSASPRRWRTTVVALCKECPRPAQAFGRCNLHYLRWRKANPKQCDCGNWHHCRGNVCARCRSRALYAKGHKCPECGQRKVMTPGQRCARCLYKDRPCACGRPRIYPDSCATCYKRSNPRTRSLDAVNMARTRRAAREAKRAVRRPGA